MKKSLFVLGTALLFSTSAFADNWSYAQGGTYQRPVNRPQQSAPAYKSSANANKNSQYRMGNPLYHPRAGQKVLTGTASYYYMPREKNVPQEKTTGWTIDPMGEIGLTDRLSVFLGAQYGRFKVKSGPKATTYDAEIGARYLLGSADGFDFNVNAGLYYDKDRANNVGTVSRRTGTDLALQVGKKIQSITPYFAVGFKTDFWSKRRSSHGTDTYINPGVYVNLTKTVSMDLSYTSVIHDDAMYRAMFDIYANRNTMFTVGGFVVHPETDNNIYGVTAGVKVGF